jgi:hypothetical protein
LLLGCGRAHFDPIGDGANGDAVIVGDGITITSNIAFVTSVGPTLGSLGSLAAADAYCNGRAQAAGLPGSYVAWLSTSTTNAIDRLTGSRGWSRVDGKAFVDTPADLVAGTIFYPLDVDEFGNRVPAMMAVGTATDNNGNVVAGYTCNDYTSTSGLLWFGLSDRGTMYWTDALGTSACAGPEPIYCFGVGHSQPTTPPPSGTRHAFLLTTDWMPGTGLASADAACRGDATPAGLNGTYQALLATSTASAISRFSLSGTTWARVDEVLLADTPADLAAGRTNVPLEVSADRVYFAGGPTWSGATDPSTVGSDATTCTSWTVSSAGVGGVVGDCGAVGFDNMGGAACNQVLPVYCLEL